MAKKKLIFTPEDFEKIENLAGQGMNEEDIAWFLGIHPSTLSKKKKINDQLSQAIKRGNSKGKAFVVGKLFEKIKDGNLTAVMFYLNTKGRYAEEPNDINDPTKFDDLSAEEQLEVINNLPPDKLLKLVTQVAKMRLKKKETS